jgi:plastocyanin
MSSTRKAVFSLVAVAVVIVGGLVLMKSNQKDKPSTKVTTNNPAPSADTIKNSTTSNAVAITDYVFTSNDISVKVGTTVTWTNNGTNDHTVTADAASSDAPDSGNIASGKTYSFTFKKAGIYKYHCKYHATMLGTVNVTE